MRREFLRNLCNRAKDTHQITADLITGADRKHKSQIAFAHLHIFLYFGGGK